MGPALFIIILLTYVFACIYVGKRVTQAIENRTKKIIARIIIAIIATSFFTQRLVSNVMPESINRILYIISTMWLVFMLYAFIITLIFDFARLIAKFKNGEVPPRTMRTTWHTIGIVFIIMLVGIVNAYTPVTTHYTIHSSKMQDGDTLRIALASDLHMGYAVRSGDIERLTAKINALNADMCIIAGDLIDGDIRPVVENDLGRGLDKINAPMGTYAIMGNHEYMAGDADAEAYLRTLKITLLRDSSVTRSTNSFNIPPYISIIGRDDVSARHRGTDRKSLKELDCDTCHIKIVIDHQPMALDESESIRADLHVSGHTHAGQVWPMRTFTKMIFENDYGYSRKNDLNVIVTSGFGTWGPRIRLGNHPEVVAIDIVR